MKQWLKDNPFEEPVLKPPYQRRWGLEGLFVKYDDTEHAERKNPGLAGWDHWERFKNHLHEGDEIWKCGTTGGIFVLAIRDGSPIYKTTGNHTYFDPYHEVPLAIYG